MTTDAERWKCGLCWSMACWLRNIPRPSCFVVWWWSDHGPFWLAYIFLVSQYVTYFWKLRIMCWIVKIRTFWKFHLLEWLCMCYVTLFGIAVTYWSDVWFVMLRMIAHDGWLLIGMRVPKHTILSPPMFNSYIYELGQFDFIVCSLRWIRCVLTSYVGSYCVTLWWRIHEWLTARLTDCWFFFPYGSVGIGSVSGIGARDHRVLFCVMPLFLFDSAVVKDSCRNRVRQWCQWRDSLVFHNKQWWNVCVEFQFAPWMVRAINNCSSVSFAFSWKFVLVVSRIHSDSLYTIISNGTMDVSNSFFLRGGYVP